MRILANDIFGRQCLPYLTLLFLCSFFSHFQYFSITEKYQGQDYSPEKDQKEPPRKAHKRASLFFHALWMRIPAMVKVTIK